MNTRERFRRVMHFQQVDRLPVIESYWWWDQTLERWYAEGLPRALVEHADIARYLGLDGHYIFWVHPREQFTPPPGRNRDEGVIHNVEEYDRHARGMFERIDLDAEVLARRRAEQERGDVFVWLQIDGFFWFPRELLGVERHLLAFYDQPELLHRINRDLADYTLRLLEAVCEHLTPDMVTLAEDMSYNHGPMLSRACFDAFLAPYYRRVVPELTRRGILPFVDSDGDLGPMIPWLEDEGLTGASPLERRAGNDLAALRAAHPRFRILGGFDKTVMHRGEQAMRAEFERLLPVMRHGGYIPSVDHQTPPDVSLADYHVYVTLLHEYCARAAKA